MSYVLPKHTIAFNANFTLEEGYLPTILNDFMPFVSIEKRPQQGSAVVWGLFAEAIYNAAHYARFKLSLVNEKNLIYGVASQNGSFPEDTTFGYFQAGKAMGYSGPGIAELDRFEVAEPVEIRITSYGLLTWKPRKVIDPFGFVSAFKAEVWLCLGLTTIFLAALSALIDRFISWTHHSPKGFASHLWEFYRRLFPQASSEAQDSWQRIILMSYMLSISVLFMTILNSELTSKMLVMKSTPTVDSYEDVPRFPKLKIFTEKNSALHTIFLNAQSNLFRTLQPRVVPVTGIFRWSAQTFKMLSDIEEHKAVMVLNDDMGHALILEASKRWNRCPNLKLSREGAGFFSANAFINRLAPDNIRRTFRRGFRATGESGLTFQIVGWQRRDSIKCIDQDHGNLEALSIDQLEGAFAILAIGIGLSIIVMLIEVMPPLRWKSSIPCGR